MRPRWCASRASSAACGVSGMIARVTPGGQVEDPAVACQVLPEVVDDHGQQRRALVGDGVLAGLGLVEQQAQAQQGNAERRHQLPRVTLRPFSRLRAWLSW